MKYLLVLSLVLTGCSTAQFGRGMSAMGSSMSNSAAQNKTYHSDCYGSNGSYSCTTR